MADLQASAPCCLGHAVYAGGGAHGCLRPRALRTVKSVIAEEKHGLFDDKAAGKARNSSVLSLVRSLPVVWAPTFTLRRPLL